MSLLHKDNLKYVGCFRVPVHNQPDGTYGYYYGGTALSYNPFSDTLVMCGHDHKQWIGEFNLAEPRVASSIDELETAEPIEEPTDWLQGKTSLVDGDTGNGIKIGGILVLGESKYFVSVWNYYDAGSPKQTLSHFLVLKAKNEVHGPFQIGKGWQKYHPPDVNTIAGMVSGYMCPVPPEAQGISGVVETNVGYLTGQGGGISVVSRTSSGPSATLFNPLAENKITTANLCMGYPEIESFEHQTLGIWGQGGGLDLYDGTQYFRGMIFPDGYHSVLYFGWGGSAFCYGAGSSDESKHFQPLDPPQYDASGELVHYCYDPINNSKGTHGYPYKSIVYAYDFNDFLAAKNGVKLPYDVVPYDTWALDTLPFQEKLVDGVDMGNYSIMGAAYKSTTREIFVSAYRCDGDRPLIHVFKVQ